MKPTPEEIDTMVEEVSADQVTEKKNIEQSTENEEQNSLNGVDPSLGDALKVRAKGPGLLSGHVNQYGVFHLDARKAGCGDVDVVIKGPSQAAITFVEEKEAYYRVHYIVTLPGDYFIEIRFNSGHIPGSPFPLYIGFDRSGASSLTGSVHSLDNINTAETTDCNANVVQTSSPKHESGKPKRSKKLSSLLQAIVESPSGVTLKGELIRKVDKTFAVTFPHPEVGTYLVNISNTVTGKAIRGSPFKININEIAEEEEMRVTGKALERCRLGEAGIIKFQARENLDPANLIVAFEGNGLSSLRAVQSDSSSVDFLFVPKKAGILKMHAYYKGTFLKDSPFEIRVTNRSVMMSKYEILPTPLSSQYSKVIFWIGFSTNHPVQTNVISPSAAKVEHNLCSFDEGSFELSFLPKEPGEYKLEVSTYESKGPITFSLFNESKRTDDNELLDVHVDYPNESEIGEQCLLVLTSAVGPVHQLSVEFKGPGKIDINQVIEKNKVLIYYEGTMPGNYRFRVFRDGVPVVGTPWYFTLSETK